MRIHRLLQCALAALLLPLMCARESLAQNSTVELHMGSIRVERKESDFLNFALKDGKTVRVEDRAGSYRPPVHIDDQGFIYVGDKILDSHTGLIIRNDNNPDLVIVGPRLGVLGGASAKKLTLVRKAGACEVQFDAQQKNPPGPEMQSGLGERVYFADSANALAVLSGAFTDNGEKLDYRVSIVEPRTCRVTSSVDLGNPDFLVDLGWSPEGGFWIVGAQQPTLLRSSDGKIWTTVKLPERFSELMSVYIPGKNDIWLAALDGSDPHAVDSPSLIHSADGGKTWQTLTWHSPLLKQVPRYWLEGQMRAHGQEVK